MNTKRWIAIIIAIVILLVGSMASVSNTNLDTMEEFKGLSSLFEDDITKEVINEGTPEHRILVVRIHGVITSSLSAGGGYDHQLTLEALNSASDDDSIKGVIISVDSPGGGVFESAEIKDAIRYLTEVKKIPVYASFENMAASGGYYVSAFADKIFADEETWTGSIGVILSSFDMSQLLNNIGIEPRVIKSAAHKDIMSSYRPMTKEEEAYMQELVDGAFNRFVKVVSEGRGMSKEEVRKIADGRIYDGAMAKEIGLVDSIGSLENAIDEMKEKIGIQNPEVFEYNKLFSKWNTILPGLSIENNVREAMNIYSEISRPKLLYIYGE